MGLLPLHAQTDSANPSLVLASQDAWTPNSGTFTMSLKTGGNTDGLHITLTVHDRLLSRSAFDAHPRRQPGISADPDGEAALTRRVPRGRERRARRADRAEQPQHPPFRQRRVSDRGAAPRRQRHARSRDSSRTSWSSISRRRPRSRSTSPGCGRSSPTRRSRSTALRTPTSSASSRPTGRLGRQAAAIGADADVPLTLAPSPETLDAWLVARAGPRQPGARGGRGRIAARRDTPPGARRPVRAARPPVTRSTPGSAARFATSSTRAPTRSRASSTRTSTRAPRCRATSTPPRSTRSGPQSGPGSSSTATRSSRSTVDSPRRGPPSSGAPPDSASDAVDGRRHRSRPRGFPPRQRAPGLARRASPRRARGHPERAAEPRAGGGIRQPERLGSVRRVRHRAARRASRESARAAGHRRHPARGDAARDGRRRARR